MLRNVQRMQGARPLVLAAASTALLSCGSALPPRTPDPGACDPATAQPSRSELRCEAEFLAQAARPLDASLPGARTIKTIVDRANGDAVHFLDTNAYPLHARFARDHLSYPADGSFVEEYFLPQRRLLLGSVTHYEEPDVWAYELAPYDTASADMIAAGFRRLAAAAYFGPRLRFHPTSQEQAARAAALASDVAVVRTEDIYAGIGYQPLNLGETYAQVRLVDRLGDGPGEGPGAPTQQPVAYLSPRELAVLDRVPNDIGVVAGVITAELQTPLSHVNVLSQQRGTPNMALRDARARLGPYAGKWVHLVVGAFDWSLREVSPADADAWWQAHRPAPAAIPTPDYSVDGVLDVDRVGHADIGVVGGKAANYGELRRIAAGVRILPALAVPMAHYRRFLDQNGFAAEIAGMLADPSFLGDGGARRARLLDLQARMRAAPVDGALLAALDERLDAAFPATAMKFRSSTNAEDLERHTGAGLYESKAARAHDPVDTVADALRAVWASLWSFRAFEERAFAGIDQTQVAMAVLVSPAYQTEAANGVAVTANIFDPAPGGEDAFYINAQFGEASVVEPGPSLVADQVMYYFFHNGQPATYYARSSLARDGETVLSRSELGDLGRSLAAIREHFETMYAPPDGYGRLPMDVEWKLVGGEEAGGGRVIWVKQARPYPGRGREQP
jgi:pyruvate,water dikinase